jgi:hypothetical protein
MDHPFDHNPRTPRSLPGFGVRPPARRRSGRLLVLLIGLAGAAGVLVWLLYR